MTGALFDIAHLLLNILWFIVVVQFVMSWLIVFNVLNIHSPGVRAFVNAINRITEPMYRPIRRMLPDFGGIDFSPLVILLLIQVLHKLLNGLEAQYYLGA